MPIAKVQLPDGRVARLEVPEGTTPEQVQAEAQRLFQPTPKSLGADAFPDVLREEMRGQGWGNRQLIGAGTALSNVKEGAKQFVGMGDKQAIEANRILADEAPAGAIAGNIAAAAIPFGAVPSTIKAATAVGAGFGALQPVAGEQSLANIAQGKAMNTAFGAASGGGGQFVANKAGAAFSNRLAALKQRQAHRAPFDQTVKEAVEAGYVIPPGQINPTFKNRALESVGGKIATQQMASNRNQAVTDALARKAAGLADDAPITPDTLKAARDAIKKPYKDIAALGMQKHLDDLDALRAEAKAAWKEYSRQGTRASLKDYQSFSSQAQTLEREIEKALFKLNKPDLMRQFRNARVALAKNHNVEDALVEGSGSVDARVFAKLLQHGGKMTGELKTIAAFGNNFPKITQPDKMVGTPDAHNLKAMMGAAMGGGGAAAMGPAGIALGAIPFVSPPIARGLLFSGRAQKALANPSYKLPVSERVAAGLLDNAPVGFTALGFEALR